MQGKRERPVLQCQDRAKYAGAKARTRTADRTIFSRELYQLSYLGLLHWELRALNQWAIEGSNL